MFQHLRSRVSGLGPRAAKRVDKSVDEIRADLRALRDLLKPLREDAAAARHASAGSSKALQEVTDELRMLKNELAAVRVRESQLRAIVRADIAFGEEVAAIDAIFQDPTLAAHVTAAVTGATLHVEPFPYMVVDNLLPKAMYRLLINALPPAELFVDQPVNKQQLKVPLELAPAYSRRVWRFMADVIAEQFIQPVALQAFRAPITDWLRQNFPALGDNPSEGVTMNCSGGRILRRGRGYRIPPHRDPKWGFVTCLMYLARRGDDESWGTQLYSVDDDQEAQGAAPHWIDPSRCHLVENVAFKRNRALIFLNSLGAHGAVIPEDAQPPDLDRYAYQFRIGPDAASIMAVTAKLPEERRAAWTGKIAEY